MAKVKYLQDLIPLNNPIRGCYGCGADNPHGLHVKSFIQGDEGIAHWQPMEHHQAFPGFLNGGVAATLIDCHSACTAIALDCIDRGLDPENDVDKWPDGWTKAMTVEYLRPTPINKEITLRAKIVKKGRKSITVACSLFADGEECVKGEVVIVIPTS